MSKRESNKKKPKTKRDSAEKRVRQFLRDNPSLKGRDLLRALLHARINISAGRLMQIERELGHPSA